MTQYLGLGGMAALVLGALMRGGSYASSKHQDLQVTETSDRALRPLRLIGSSGITMNGGYLNHGPTVRQSQRAALKVKNRAKHRRACR